MVIKSFENYKAAREDSICGESLKLWELSLSYGILKLICLILYKEEILVEWRTSIICPTLKKGDLKCKENYRGISPPKTITRNIGARNVDYQCGFRKEKPTTDHNIFAVR